MRKLTIMLIFMAFLGAACSDGGDAFDPETSLSEGTMAEVSVVITSQSGTTGFLTEKTITVDSTRQIAVSEVVTGSESKVLDECTGIGEISEDDFLSLETTVIAADPLNYEPLDDLSCSSPLGMSGFDLVYKSVVGEEVELTTGNCEEEVEMNNLYLMMTGLADQYVTDCSESTLGDDDGGDLGDDDVVIYRVTVPIINPRDLPIPRKVTF